MAATIRPFVETDTAAVHRIGADTARYGEPVEAIMNDRRLFIDIFMRPYTTHYPDTCWVAEVDGDVVGYLTGCLDTAHHAAMFRQAVLRAARRALLLHYRLGWRTVRAGIGFAREMLARPPSPDLAAYPAHLHINVAASQRGQGLGRRLMDTYLDYCRAQHVPGVHLSTSERNHAALHLYRRLGFELLHRYRSPYQSTVSRQPVDTLIMGLSLRCA
jgi:ribosomal protein S18 acetylase RimI-like enzyme